MIKTKKEIEETTIRLRFQNWEELEAEQSYWKEVGKFGAESKQAQCTIEKEKEKGRRGREMITKQLRQRNNKGKYDYVLRLTKWQTN